MAALSQYKQCGHFCRRMTWKLVSDLRFRVLGGLAVHCYQSNSTPPDSKKEYTRILLFCKNYLSIILLVLYCSSIFSTMWKKITFSTPFKLFFGFFGFYFGLVLVFGFGLVSIFGCSYQIPFTNDCRTSVWPLESSKIQYNLKWTWRGGTFCSFLGYNYRSTGYDNSSSYLYYSFKVLTITLKW